MRLEEARPEWPLRRGNKSSPLFFTSLPPHKQRLWLLVSQPHALLLAWLPASPARQPRGTLVLTSRCLAVGVPNAADPQAPQHGQCRAESEPQAERPPAPALGPQLLICVTGCTPVLNVELFVRAEMRYCVYTVFPGDCQLSPGITMCQALCLDFDTSNRILETALCHGAALLPTLQVREWRPRSRVVHSESITVEV